MVRKTKSIVTIVQQDRGQDETILQIAFSLDTLEKVAANIFSHVESNLEKSKQRLASLQSRCLAVQSKVEKVTGINKSITVYCSSKYPGTSKDRHYKYDFKPVAISPPEVKVKYRPLPPEKLSLREKLKFFHVKDRVHQMRKNVDILPLEGLGNLPEDIKSVSSLLLFNTNQNVFNSYRLLDPLSSTYRNVTVEENLIETQKIEPAPISILFNDETSYKADRNFFYSPSLQNVPQMEAPLDLPDLPGIAGDLRYCIDHPSVEKSFSNEAREVSDRITEDMPTIVEALPKLDTDAGETQLPPPPPPQPPPPPPPPLPPTTQDSAEATNFGTENSAQQLLISSNSLGGDTRANLMEAIRNAGGSAKANLKSISKLKSPQDNKVVKKTGGNLMDDLHAKLSMRRKGISGKIDNPEGMMEKIVSMIPPPPSKEPEAEVDDEWDD